MSAHTFGPRIDYLKFVVAMDWDLGQQTMAKITRAAQVEGFPLREGENIKFSVLGPTQSAPGKNRYVVEAWGESAVHLATIVPDDFWHNLNRIDWRCPTTKTQPQAFEAFVVRQAMSKTSGRNLTTFNTKGRKKGPTRDVGGRGVLSGSRKSDSHTVAYMRAGDAPVVECRFQGRKAEHIGALVAEMLANKEQTTAEADLLKILKNFVPVELNRAFGASSIADLEIDIDQAGRQMERVKQAMTFDEVEQARIYEQETPPDDQEADQLARYVPTSLFKGPAVRNAKPISQRVIERAAADRAADLGEDWDRERREWAEEQERISSQPGYYDNVE